MQILQKTKANLLNAETGIAKIALQMEFGTKTDQNLNLSNGSSVESVDLNLLPLNVEWDTVNNVHPKDWDTKWEDVNFRNCIQGREIQIMSMEKHHKVSKTGKINGIHGADSFFINTTTNAYYLDARTIFNAIMSSLLPRCLYCDSTLTMA